MGQEITTSDESAIDELRQILPGSSAIKPHGDGYEVIVFPSNIDNALTFFVTFPKSQMRGAETRAAPTEPEDVD